MINAGVYAIKNTLNGRVYVGSTLDIKFRWRSHRRGLVKGNHHSLLLQRSWNKYGADAFQFEILEEQSAPELLLIREQFWIDEKDAANPEHGFNICPLAGRTFGRITTQETRQKQSVSQRLRTPEDRAQISASLMGHRHSDETLAKMRGRKHTPEELLKMSLSQKGRVISDEMKARISAKLMGQSRGKQPADVVAKRVASTRATKIARGIIQP